MKSQLVFNIKSSLAISSPKESPLKFQITSLLLACFLATATVASAADSTDASIAAYADAANFQTNGAFDLAIDSWKKFLKKYPKDEMSPKAAHYLGVCYMQQEKPDYVAAARAFTDALKNKDYELREESLANQGWCWYASSGESPNRDKKRLQLTIDSYATLRKEKPNSRFLDRALFYSGEAAYGLGDRKKAIDFYNKLLALPSAGKSPLRCDALYARGIAHEELDQFDNALASFDQLMNSCKDDDLVTDVHLRMGDVKIYRKEYTQAVESFEAAIETAETDDDKSYAIFRQAYALVQANRPGEAAKKYDILQKEFPKSQYAATALLAAAQSTYRSGDLDEAAKRFAKVRQQNNKAASTEAAHWLARIYIAKNKPDEAVKVAEEQIDQGTEGEYAIELKLDLAESLALNPKTVAKSVEIAESVYRDAPKNKLAPRALYNAAFSALQTNQLDKASTLSGEFLKNFPKDDLSADVQFISAESQLLTGKLDLAAESYDRLLKQTGAKGNVQRPLWVLRAATTSNAARKFDTTIALIKREYSSLGQPAQKAEAQMLLGQAYMGSTKHSDAAMAYQRCSEADPKWARAEEAQLLSGTALFAADKRDEAKAVWERLVSSKKNPRMANQARYKLAQMASNKKDHDTAVRLYDEILESDADKGLKPYALYGKGWALMQSDKHDQAIKPLDEAMKDYKTHTIADDLMLARGITLRHLGKYDQASEDLAEYLTTKPGGTNLGHALYEMALIDQKQKQPGRAASRLQRLVKEVPKYPSMDKVLYELGWSLRESGNDKEAEKYFGELVKQFPQTGVAGEAAYFIGQKRYSDKQWKAAAQQFAVAASRATDDGLSEKAHYRLGWSHFKSEDFTNAEKAFSEQASKHPEGKLALDALMMVGECRFKSSQYPQALQAYDVARRRIRDNNDNANSIREPAERQVRELILLHGGQCAAQSKQWDTAIQWYDELKERFPTTSYMPQVFYETGFAYQQKKDPNRAIKFFTEVADNYRNEIAARARFMIGEIHFGNKELDKAIPEFQRVMFGFGADKAPDDIKNWQAKSGFEAARCSELLVQRARSADGRQRAVQYAQKFYDYVITKHPKHELAGKARDRRDKVK